MGLWRKESVTLNSNKEKTALVPPQAGQYILNKVLERQGSVCENLRQIINAKPIKSAIASISKSLRNKFF